MSLSDSILDFIRDQILRDASAPLQVDDSLIEAGILDSMALIKLISFIEDQTGVRVPDAAVTPDHFDSARAIEALVEGLRRSG